MNILNDLKSLERDIDSLTDRKVVGFYEDLECLFSSLYSFLETLVDKLEDLEDKIDKITESVYPQS